MYRIKEHLGYFQVEQFIIEITYEDTFLSRLIPKIFKRKTTTKEKWVSLSSNGYASNFINHALRFKTKDKAIDFIKSLEPKYHEVKLNNK